MSSTLKLQSNIKGCKAQIRIHITLPQTKGRLTYREVLGFGFKYIH